MNTIYDCIVIGSGAAGVWACEGLKGLNVLVLDVGYQSQVPFPQQTLEEIKNDPKIRREMMLGSKFESLHNIFYEYLSPKLKAPQMRFVIECPDSEKVLLDQFLALQSFSKGGLANAWGAGAFKLNSSEMESFPISPQDLDAAYDEVIKEIGVSGVNDDLTKFFGSSDFHLPPLPLPNILSELKSRYEKKKQKFQSQGLTIGEGRMACLSQPHNGRPGYSQMGTDFFFSGNQSIYTPAITLDRLIEQKAITYRNHVLAVSFTEGETTEVLVKDLKTNQMLEYKAKKLILAMGALNTTKFVLNSYEDYDEKRPLLDNNITYIPFVDLHSIGKKWTQKHMLGAPLVGVHKKSEHDDGVQMTIYPVGSVLCSDLLGYFPLDLKSSYQAGRHLIPAMIAVQLFYPDKPSAGNFIQLGRNGQLQTNYQRKAYGTIERSLIQIFRQVGLISAPFLIQAPKPGNSFHYAGMLPMKRNPIGKYETSPTGLLNGTRGIYIADAANFPVLPAKNHTLTIMANALRIGRHVKEAICTP